MPYVEYDEVEAICPDCGRIFRSEDALAAHREESHSGLEEPPRVAPPASVRCALCAREFATEASLRSHVTRTHRGAAGDPPR
jgi:uncharacterized C2H2 Zn-finger protein